MRRRPPSGQEARRLEDEGSRAHGRDGFRPAELCDLLEEPAVRDDVLPAYAKFAKFGAAAWTRGSGNGHQLASMDDIQHVVRRIVSAPSATLSNSGKTSMTEIRERARAIGILSI